MNKFIKNIAKFILFFIPIFLGLFMILSLNPALRIFSNIRFVNQEASYLRGQEAKRVNNIDILFIGPSLCCLGFDVRIFKSFGYNTFNLGSSAQTMIQTKYLLRQYLKKIKPKLVIYAIDPFVTTSKGGVESTCDIISNQYLSEGLSLQMLFEVNDPKLYNTFLYSYLYKTILPKNTIVDDNQKYIEGGFVESKIAYYKYSKIPTVSHIFDKKQQKALKEIKEIFEESNQKFFFVYPPITLNQYNSINNNEEFIADIGKFGDIYNFNNNKFLNDTLHYLDAVHLNQHGVDIYNHEFLKRLKPKIDSLIK